MDPCYTAKLRLTPKTTNVGVQKINNLPLKTQKLIIAGFLIIDKFEQIRFFEKAFLLVDTNM